MPANFVSANFVCFELLTEDPTEIEEYHRTIYPNGSTDTGIIGSNASVSPALLSVTLGPEVNAREWLFNLPRDVTMDPIVRSIRTTERDCVAEGISPSTSPETRPLTDELTNFVCFELLTEDWTAIGDYQRMFYTEGDLIEGVVGSSLSTSPPRVSVTLSPEEDATDWIARLPRRFTANQVVGSIQATEKDCATEEISSGGA